LGNLVVLEHACGGGAPLLHYQRDSDPLENAAESVTWSGELVLCLDRCWLVTSPSSSPEEFSLWLTLSVDSDELKLALISPLRVKGKLLV